MIIKVKTHKRKQAIRHLAEYILSDKGRSDDEKSFSIFHNMDASDVKGVVNAFQENEKYRPNRKNGVVLQHHILSFSPDDNVDLETGHELAQKWLDVRQEEGLCFARAHVDNDHFHVHMLISGNKWRSPESTRKSKFQLQDDHRQLEEFQQERFPDLVHSLVKIRQPERDKACETEAEKHIKQRTETKKELVKKLVHQAWQESYNSQEFYGKLANHGLGLYEYRGQLRGVLDGTKKYRFSTLGLDVSLIGELDDEKARRRKELEHLNQPSGRDRGLER